MPDPEQLFPNNDLSIFYLKKHSSLSKELAKSSFKEIIKSRPLASLGDFLINYCYTVARFHVAPIEHKAIRVWDSSLAKALKESEFANYLPSRMSSGELGDAVEAMVAWLYMTGRMSLEEMIEIMLPGLDPSLIGKPGEKDLAVFAISLFLEHVWERRIYPRISG